ELTRRRVCMSGRVRHGHDARLPRLLLLAGLIGATLLNSGCVMTGPLDWIHNGFKVGPNYCRPPAPVAPEWIEAKDPRVQGPRRDGDWWAVFQDPILNCLIGRAYQQNTNLRAVGTRVFQARAQQAIAVGNIFPQTQQVEGLYNHGQFAGNPIHLDLTAFN